MQDHHAALLNGLLVAGQVEFFKLLAEKLGIPAEKYHSFDPCELLEMFEKPDGAAKMSDDIE